MTKQRPDSSIAAICLPLALVAALTARAMAQAQQYQSAALAAFFAVLLLVVGGSALYTAITAPRSSVLGRSVLGARDQPQRHLDRIKAQVRAARPDVPAHIIDNAATPSDLAQRLIRWDHLHATGSRPRRK